jgi:lysophospholipid acyltransferase (LPLAT)-like uncharacterized protein
MSGAATTRRWRRPLRSLLAALAPPLLRTVCRLIIWSLRVEYRGEAALRARWASGGRAVLSFWHNRQLLLPLMASFAPMCVMVSHSRDGEMATKVLRAWRVETVRGSASRGAVAGFLRLARAYRDGHNLAVLPDGPRGPRYVAKPGVVYLAKTLDTPIYPMTYAASRAVALRSWDGLIIPLPFARVLVEVGEPLSVPADADAAQLEALRATLDERLRGLTDAVEAEMTRRSPAATRRAA